TPTKVLYLNYEVAAWYCQRRIRGQLAGLDRQVIMTPPQINLTSKNVVVETLSSRRLNHVGAVGGLGECQDKGNSGMVISDSVRGAIKDDRNKDETIDAIMQSLLDQVVKVSGAAIVLGHHMRKPQPGEALTGSTWDVKGAGAFSDAADNIIVMWRDKKDRTTTYMGFTLRHYEGIDNYGVAFQPASKVFKPLHTAPSPPADISQVSSDDLI